MLFFFGGKKSIRGADGSVELDHPHPHFSVKKGASAPAPAPTQAAPANYPGWGLVGWLVGTVGGWRR